MYRDRQSDALLDRFIPVYDIVERHSIAVKAPPEITFAAACEMDPGRSWIVRAVFRLREILFRSRAPARALPSGILAKTKALGWGVLAEVPGREIVMGAVTQPWLADVQFRALPPAEFAGFRDPGYVKIAWTLSAIPAAGGSVFLTETRAVATDPAARARFRAYWRRVSPGIRLIRRAMLCPLKKEAERRAAGEVPCASHASS